MLRIQKYLAHLGVASRRKIEQWIREGRLTIHQKPVQLGQQVEETDLIFLDGVPLQKKVIEKRLILLNKPVGYLCSRRNEKGLSTVFELLPPLSHGRWVSVGRLDVNTSGLLLFTTDGELAERLMHPRYGARREYHVRVSGLGIKKAAEKILQGVVLEEGLVKVQELIPIKTEGRNHWYQMVLTEGRNRVVRRLWEACGCSVNRLIRIGYAEFKLPRDLKKGEWREIRMN